MPLTTAAKNVALNALKGTSPASAITHVGLLQAGASKAVTGAGSTDLLTSAGHGYSDGDLVVLSALTGGAGLVAGDPYFVRDAATNTFKVARSSGGTAVDITSDLSAGTVKRLVELSGGSPAYARQTITFAAAADGIMDDTATGGPINVPPGSTVDYEGYWSALTSGTLMGVDPAAGEAYVGQGTYTVTDTTVSLPS